MLTTTSLAQVDKALNGLDSNLFCHDTGSIQGQPIFFSFYSFTFKNQLEDIYLKSCYVAEKAGDIFYTSYCHKTQHVNFDQVSKQMPFGQKRDAMH